MGLIKACILCPHGVPYVKTVIRSVRRCLNYRSKKLSRLLRHRLSAKSRNVPTVTTHRQEKALQVETMFKDIPCRHTAQRESAESPVVTRCHDTCPVSRFSVCREAAFNGRNQVILIFIMEHSDFFTRFTPIFCPVVFVPHGRHHDDRLAISLLNHPVQNVLLCAAQCFKCFLCRSRPSVHQVDHIILPALVISVRQIDIGRLPRGRTVIAGIIFRFIFDSYYLPLLCCLRKVLIGNRMGHLNLKTVSIGCSVSIHISRDFCFFRTRP